MIGREIGNYRIVSLLGEGGMGIVYLAEHQTIERQVAVKFLRGEHMTNADATTRFVNEARVASTLRHPNVIEVFDTGVLQPEGVPFIIMEVLEGEPLVDRLARVGRLATEEALRWANETATALGVAHAKNIVHRDLKPANLFLVADPSGGGEKIKVLDFGIAKARGLGLGSTTQTQTGSIMGTPCYMSPEQCSGGREIDTRSDIYSLGIILYEMLCGAPPFSARGMGELISLHLTATPAPPRTHDPAIPEPLERAILRTLAKQPDERFATVQELQVALGFLPFRGSATPAVGVRASASALAAQGGGARFRGGPTEVRGGSVLMSSKDLPGAKEPLRSGAHTKRLLPIAGGVLAVLAVALVFLHGQLGPRVACMTGRSCAALGDCYWSGSCGVRKDVKAACGLYDESCADGDRDSCVGAGRCAEIRTGVVETNWRRACDLYEKACDRGSPAGCAHLGECYREGVAGRARDVNRGCALAKRACDGSDQLGCALLGECHARGRGDPPGERSRGCELGKSACLAGELFGCTVRANHCFDTRVDEAGREMSKACEDGEPNACGLLAYAYLEGESGFVKDPARGCALAAKACEGQGFREDGCLILTVCHEQGTGGFAKDPEKALAVLSRRCNAGSPTSCARAGDSLATGRDGFPVDPVRACGYHEKACDAGGDCRPIARCFCTGSGGARNPARAHELYDRECKRGTQQACDEDKAGRCGAEAAPAPAPVASAPRTTDAPAGNGLPGRTTPAAYAPALSQKDRGKARRFARGGATRAGLEDNSVPVEVE